MVSDPAPFFAFSFLHYHKGRWISKLRKSDIRRAGEFVNIFRFIVDLTTIYDGREIERNCKKIYPPELELKKEDISYFEGSFLDLEIKIEHKKLNILLYHKKNGFSFSIVEMPCSKMLCSTFIAEILRTGCTTSKCKSFCKTSENLIREIYKQGSNITVFARKLTKIYDRHFQTFWKFYNNSRKFVDLLSK